VATVNGAVMMELKVSLLDVIRQDLGDPAHWGRQPVWHCPFHDDRSPSFTLMPDGRRWKCFGGCDCSGDAIDFIMLRRGLPFKEAVAFLEGGIGRFSHTERLAFSPKKHSQELSMAHAAFRQHGSQIVQDCVDRLHSPQGVRAFRWLRLRGLRPETVRSGRIGYNPMDRVACGIFLKRGITIPWVNGDQVQGIKIRRPAANPKYIWVKGQSRSGLYLGDSLMAGCPTVLTEGEFDALLGRQEFGGLVNVASLGSASDPPDDRSLEQLLGSPLILLCYDSDAAGRKGEDRWCQVTRRVRVLRLPAGMDLTDLHRITPDLRGWLTQQLHRFGLRNTLHPTVGDNHGYTNEIDVGSGTLHLPYTSS